MAEGREMRSAYCDALINLAKKDKRVVILDADLMKASGIMPFKKEFNDRAIDVGVAEANMIGVASGLSLKGYIPFASTFSCFAARRDFDQFFLSSNYAKLNVKLVGTDPGVSAAFNGGTHMSFEDIGLMRNIPDLTIVEPSDATSAEAFTNLIYEKEGCCYMRLHRKSIDDVYSKGEKFEIGKAKVLKEGSDVLLLSLGAVMVREALKCAEILEKSSIKACVVDVLSVYPFDKELILPLIEKTSCVITCENHQLATGLGSQVATLMALEGISKKFAMIGINNRFGQVGTQDYLIKEYSLSCEDIANKAKSMLRTTAKITLGKSGLGFKK